MDVKYSANIETAVHGIIYLADENEGIMMTVASVVHAFYSAKCTIY